MGELLGRGKGCRETTAVHCSWLPPALPAVYVGLATVAAATWWFLYDADGPHITFYQLVSDSQGACWGDFRVGVSGGRGPEP